MIDIEGKYLNQEDKQILSRSEIGGLILFSRNIESPKQVVDLCNQVRTINPNIIIGIDQEGGRVQRIKSGVTRIPPMRKLASIASEKNKTQWIRDCGWLMASEMIALGIDISFAPVLDIDRGNNQIVGDRSFSKNIPDLISYANEFISGMHSAGMAATGKHFPGHGGVKEDSHLALPLDSRTNEVLNEDASVFKALLPKLQGMMTAHIIYSEFDPEYPASFSHFWLQTILKEKFAYQGIIFSDDLSMEGAKTFGDICSTSKMALDAGCDMLLICNDRQSVLTLLDKYPQQRPIDDAFKKFETLRFQGSRTSLETLKNSERWKQTHKILERIND